jgi:AraC-like DNA-binding protein
MRQSDNLDKKAIPLGMIRTNVKLAESLGFNTAMVLAGSNIAISDLDNIEHRVSYRQRIRVLENILRLVNQPDYWLALEQEISISDFGLLGYAMVSSATLEKAIQIAVKYHKMAGAMFELSFFREGDDAVLRLDNLLADGPVGEYLVQDLFKGISPLIGVLTGEVFTPSKINLDYSPVSQRLNYTRAFNCDVEFNQRYCEYRFDAALLDKKLAAADSDTARSCEEACRRLLIQIDIEDDLISRICTLLLSTPGEFPKLDSVAASLSLGTRTLRRRLKSLNTSYQKVLDSVKQKLAMQYLQSTTLSVQEISDLLGYSEVTNFRRAFVKWADMSPYQYRKQFLDQDRQTQLGY